MFLVLAVNLDFVVDPRLRVMLGENVFQRALDSVAGLEPVAV